METTAAEAGEWASALRSIQHRFVDGLNRRSPSLMDQAGFTEGNWFDYMTKLATWARANKDSNWGGYGFASMPIPIPGRRDEFRIQFNQVSQNDFQSALWFVALPYIFEFDQNGNPRAKTRGDGSVRYWYNPRKRVQHWTDRKVRADVLARDLKSELRNRNDAHSVEAPRTHQRAVRLLESLIRLGERINLDPRLMVECNATLQGYGITNSKTRRADGETADLFDDPKFASGEKAYLSLGGQLYTLCEGQELLIGRHADCKIRIDQDEVSRKHAKFRMSDGYVTVEDLGSRNGTFLNQDTILSNWPMNLVDCDLVTVLKRPPFPDGRDMSISIEVVKA